MRVKLEVGQVWRYKNSPNTFTITRVTAKASYHRDSRGELIFAHCDGEDWIAEISDDWLMIGMTGMVGAKGVAPDIAPAHKDTFAFFKAVAPGNCPCNIPQSQCSFHSKGQ